MYEVMFDEYDRFATATGGRRPTIRVGPGPAPVINVAWRDACAYADWLSDRTGARYRLPTERNGNTRRAPVGDEPLLGR